MSPPPCRKHWAKPCATWAWPRSVRPNCARWPATCRRSAARCWSCTAATWRCGSTPPHWSSSWASPVPAAPCPPVTRCASSSTACTTTFPNWTSWPNACSPSGAVARACGATPAPAAGRPPRRAGGSGRAAGRARERQYDAGTRRLWLPDYLEPGQQAFQMAAELALHGYLPQIDAVVARAGFTDEARIAQARVGLSNYFAGALVMPYMRFLRAAEASSYDIELLAHQFGVGFEAVCHRLSTLARRSAPGLPFFFIRVDRAGNVSKRHSATDFHFSQVGGSCPCGSSTRRSTSPGASSPRPRACPMAAAISGWRGRSAVARWAMASPQDLRGGAGLRSAACRTPGVFAGAGCAEPGQLGVDRAGLPGVPARGLHAARVRAIAGAIGVLRGCALHLR